MSVVASVSPAMLRPAVLAILATLLILVVLPAALGAQAAAIQ